MKSENVWKLLLSAGALECVTWIAYHSDMDENLTQLLLAATIITDIYAYYEVGKHVYDNYQKSLDWMHCAIKLDIPFFSNHLKKEVLKNNPVGSISYALFDVNLSMRK